MNDIDCDLRTDAVPDQPRDVIKNEISINNGTDVNGNGNAPKSSQDESKTESSPIPNIKAESSHARTTNSTKDKKNWTSKDGTRKGPKPKAATAIVYNINKSSGVHIGNNVVIQCGPNSMRASTNTPTSTKETKEIKKLLQSTDPITLDDIDLTSTHVGANWMEVGRHLDYTNGQLEQFHEDNRSKGLKEVVYQMLLDWKQVNTSKATVGTLCTALWTSKQHDAVEVLAKKTSKKS